MALTLTLDRTRYPSGGGVELDFSVAWDSSYPTNGETFDVSAYVSGSPDVQCFPSQGWDAEHDAGTAAAGKLVLYDASGAEEANTTDVSAITAMRVRVFGIPV